MRFFKKTGLMLSAFAVLFVAVVLPFHHHEKKEHAENHCVVCHFAVNAHSPAPKSPQISQPIFEKNGSVFEPAFSFFAVSRPNDSSPRAPPSA